MKRINLISFLAITAMFQTGLNFASDDKRENGNAEHGQVSLGTKYISTDLALDKYSGELKNTQFHVFPESRANPIQYYDSVKISWIEQDFSTQEFKLEAQPDEYFVYQIGVWALSKDLENIEIKLADFESDDGKKLSRQLMTCFNKEGVDFEGKAFVKQVSLHAGRVQALWLGIDLEGISAGVYHGAITIGTEQTAKTVKLALEIKGEPVVNHGFDNGKNLSRMAWLNSTIGLNEKTTEGFSEIERHGNRLDILGRSLTIDESGLPKTIISFFEPSNQFLLEEGAPLIDKPFRFVIEKESGEMVKLNPGKLEFTVKTPSQIQWQITNTSEDCNLLVQGKMEYDGFLDYRLTLTANKSLKIKDIRLEVPLNKDKAKYMMGLNHEGGLRQQDWQWRWDTNKNQDMLWVGNVNGGMRMKLKAENYVRPLVNIYYEFNQLNLPPSWGNGGKGGVTVKDEGETVLLKAFSGSRELTESQQLHYDFEILVTPFKLIDKSIKYGDRYFHGGGRLAHEKVGKAQDAGANIINIHHAEDIYPFINYPYLDENRAELKQLVDDAHSKNKRLKLYYTTRELTVKTPEFWALNSLNGELIFPGPGNESVTLIHKKGPHAWLKENLREKYIPAWYNPIHDGKFKGAFDLSVITTPDSRLNNFYIGGLDWMVRHLGIDGVYIDDSALDRITLRRARKTIDRHRPEGRIDLHSWNHFNEYAGYANCLNMYMDLLPYFDLVWIGEGRDYNRMPDHWLIEVSGIPYGLPGQMLQGGGNPWRGMVYGITNRAGWDGVGPSSIWEFWDKFHIEDKQMVGYWDKQSPIKIDNSWIRATIFKGKGQSIIAVANWDEQDQECAISLDWKKLGFNSKSYAVEQPFIKNYQEKENIRSLKKLKIPGGKGFLIVIKNDEKK